MIGRNRAAALCAVALATLPPVLTLPGALTARRAAQESALEAEVLATNIDYLEARLARDRWNWLVAGHLADLYQARFRLTAELADVTRAEKLIQTTLPLRSDPSPGLARLSSLLLGQHRFAEAYEAAREAAAVPFPSDMALAALVDAARAFGKDAVADSAFARITPATFAAAVRTAPTSSSRGAGQRVHRACERLAEQGASRDLRAWCVTRLAAIEAPRGAVAVQRRLDEALRIQPDHRGALEAAADLAYASGDWKRARRLYARILSDAHPDLSLRLAEVNRLLGHDEEAAFHEGRFVSLASDPGREALFGLELALYLARGGACERARPLAAAELERRHAVEAVEGVAWVHYLCGDLERASALLQAAASRTTETGEYLRALVLRRENPEAADRAILEATADPTGLAPYAVYHHSISAAGS